MSETDDRERVNSIVYEVPVSPHVDTPLAAGVYTVRIIEGEIYRSRATHRVYSLREIDPETGAIRYEYTRGDAGERVEREDHATALAVVDGIRGSTGGVIDFEPSWSGDEETDNGYA